MRRVFTQSLSQKVCALYGALFILPLVHVQAALAASEHGEAVAHAIEHATEGGAHHESSGGLPQLNPATFPSQIFWLAITFLLMYLIFAKKTLPEISGVIEDRQERIQGDLSEAEKLKEEAENVHKNYEEALNEAREKSSEAMIEAEKEIKAKTAKALDTFREKSLSKTQSVEKEVLKVKKEAMKDMDTIAAEIASQAAEKIVGITTDIKQAKSVIENINKKAA